MVRRSSVFDARSAATKVASPPHATALSRRFASGTSLLALGAVLWPVVQNWRRVPSDGFPFSYYPMFSAYRSGRTRVTPLVGVEAGGKRHLLHNRYAGSGGQNQVRRQIRRMANEGRADELCVRVIARLAREKPRLHRRLAAVQLVTGTFLLDDYFGGGSREPLREKVHATVVVQPASDIAPKQGTLVHSIHKGPA